MWLYISGANFIMYPDNTRLVVADPNPHFEQYFKDHKAKFPHIKCETVIVAKGTETTLIGAPSYLGNGNAS